MFDEDRDKKVEFLGKVAIPLLRVRDLVSLRMMGWGGGGQGGGTVAPQWFHFLGRVICHSEDECSVQGRCFLLLLFFRCIRDSQSKCMQ